MTNLVGSTLNDGVLRSGWQGAIDSGHINPLFAEEYDTEMQRRIVELSNFKSKIQWRPAPAGGILVKNQMSGAKIQKLERSTIPGTNTPMFDQVKFAVDTAVITRTPIALIDSFLQDRDHKSEIQEEHVTELTEFSEPLIVLMAIKAAQFSAKLPDVDSTGMPVGTFTYEGGWWDKVADTWKAGWTKKERTTPPGFKGGTVVELAAANDQVDWVKLEEAILLLCQRLRLKNLDPEKGTLYMNPIQYYALMRNDRFAATAFTRPSNVTEMGQVLRVNGLEVQVTNRMPKPENIYENGVVDHNLLSNARNGFAYDTTIDDARCCILWFSKKAVLGMDLIPHRSSLYWFEMDKTWYLDDIQAFGMGVDKIHEAGGIFLNAAAYDTKAKLITAFNLHS